jgi:hypothetical protein
MAGDLDLLMANGSSRYGHTVGRSLGPGSMSSCMVGALPGRI